MPRTLAEIEAEAVKAALKYTGGDIKAAAKTLGIARGTLYKIARLNNIDLDKIRKGNGS